MILNFTKEVKELEQLFGQELSGADGLKAAMILAVVYDRGLGDMKARCLNIVARKSLNAAEVREEINRPIR